MTKRDYWFWLCGTPDIYREDIKRIFKSYTDPESVFYADKTEMVQKKIISEKQKQNMEIFAEDDLFRTVRDHQEKEGIRFIDIDDPEYPESLKMIQDPPYGIYVKGNLPDPELPSVGMVGARACSEYGRTMAFRFSKGLAAGGVQIISGMAAGIDSVSAEGALAAGGKTFAVLGSGVDVIYPAANINLYYNILMSGGGIISEYPPGTEAVAWQFPYRNRIISGLSERLLVMEAREKSGTLITVKYALEQGRDVYALPGRLTDKTSEGCNRMISDGAGILISPERLLSEILKKEISEPEEKRAEPVLEAPLKAVYRLFGSDPLSVQTIIEKSHQRPELVAAILAELELSGLIREVSKNNYSKVG